MNKQELRIGNHVLSSDQPFQIPDGNWIDLCAEMCRGILLNDDVLQQFNFEEKDFNRWYHKNIDFQVCRYGNYYIIDINEGVFEIGKRFQYLHQLQNIYYSLFQTELI